MAKSRVVHKLQVIDIVRSFCVLAVVSMHLTSAAPKPENPWAQFLWVSFTKNGIYGVFLFFAISGFLITRMITRTSPTLYKPDWGAFYVRRIARLWPLLFFVILAGVGLNLSCKTPTTAYQLCVGTSLGKGVWFFWASLLTFSVNWFIIFFHKTNGYFLGMVWGVLWSLSIEEQFYLFYPWALKKLRNEKNLMVFLTLVLLAGPFSRWIAVQSDPADFYLSLYNSFGVFDAIGMGALLFLVSEKYKIKLLKNRLACRTFCLLGGLATLVIYFGTHVSDAGDRIWAPSLLCAGLVIFLLGAIHLDFFESKWLKAFSLPGEVSYGAYLLHPFALYFLWPLLSSVEINFGFIIYFSTVFGMAWLSHRWLELPANRIIREKFDVKAPL